MTTTKKKFYLSPFIWLIVLAIIGMFYLNHKYNKEIEKNRRRKNTEKNRMEAINEIKKLKTETQSTPNEVNIKSGKK